METIVLKRNHCVTNSTIRKDHVKLSIYPWRKEVSRQILLFKQISLLRPLNGRSLMHIWMHMKKCKDLSLKNKWKIKKTRDQFNKLFKMLRILFTLLLWRELSKLWKEWSCKTLMKKSLTITNTTLTRQKKHLTPMLDLYCHFGDSPLKEVERSMLPQYAGTQDMATCLLLDTVHMISWSKIQDLYVASRLKILPSQSISSQQNQVWCVLISIHVILLF
jgi:hypothetical protein